MRLLGLCTGVLVAAGFATGQGCSRVNPAFADTEEQAYTSGGSDRPTTGSLVTSLSDSMVSDSDPTKPGSDSGESASESSEGGTRGSDGSTSEVSASEVSGSATSAGSGSGSDTAVNVCIGEAPPAFELNVANVGEPIENCNLVVTGPLVNIAPGVWELYECGGCPCALDAPLAAVVTLGNMPDWLPLNVPDCGTFRVWAPMQVGAEPCAWRAAMYSAGGTARWAAFSGTSYPDWVPHDVWLADNGCEGQCVPGPGGHALDVDSRVEIPAGVEGFVGPNSLVTNHGAVVDDFCAEVDVLWTLRPQAF